MEEPTGPTKVKENIYLVIYIEEGTEFVSHGIKLSNLENVVLPQEPLSNFSPKRDALGYYI